MANVALFKMDEYGYPRFTNSGFMPLKQAKELIATDESFKGCVPLTYREYKRDMDPDDMSEAERARRFGGKVSAPAKRVVVTGKIEGYTRAQIKEKLKELGYTVASQIDEGVSYLLCGDKAGSKLAKAEALGIRVVTDPATLY